MTTFRFTAKVIGDYFVEVRIFPTLKEMQDAVWWMSPTPEEGFTKDTIAWSESIADRIPEGALAVVFLAATYMEEDTIVHEMVHVACSGLAIAKRPPLVFSRITASPEEEDLATIVGRLYKAFEDALERTVAQDPEAPKPRSLF